MSTKAKGKREIADATAAQNEINLRETVARLIIEAEVEKMMAIGEALKGVGENVRIVQFSGQDGAGNSNNLLQALMKRQSETQVTAQLKELKTSSIKSSKGRRPPLCPPLPIRSSIWSWLSF